jgi:ElaB/YqjD/DUF883 family membrane-anchored ribosome-binding protein
MIPNPADIPPPPPAPKSTIASDASTAAAPNASTNASTVATQELLRQSIEAKDNAMKLLTSVQNVVGIAESAVREQMQARPYMTMGAAAGVGYVLAGGLASSVSRHLVRAGTKAATAFVIGVVLKKVKDAAEDAADIAQTPPEDLPTAAE